MSEPDAASNDAIVAEVRELGRKIENLSSVIAGATKTTHRSNNLMMVFSLEFEELRVHIKRALTAFERRWPELARKAAPTEDDDTHSEGTKR